ncbi:MAG: phosphate acetyltransferase [Woeseiaceae bacterium]
MKLGDSAEVTRRVGAQDLVDYTALCNHVIVGDVVPEPLIGALFSYLLGVKLPGNGANYLKQETRFHRTARVGDALTARVEVTRLRPEKKLADLSTTCTNPDGQLIASGRALVSVRDVSSRPSSHG